MAVGTSFLHGNPSETVTIRRSRNSDDFYHTSSSSTTPTTTNTAAAAAKPKSKAKNGNKNNMNKKNNMDAAQKSKATMSGGLTKYLRVLGLGKREGGKRRRLTKVRVWTEPMA